MANICNPVSPIPKCLLNRLNFRRNKLDPALQGLMGEANLRFVRGEVDTAIRMCMEVIRQEPGVPEPFQTLSALYEESGEHDRALQFALIAAHLAPQASFISDKIISLDHQTNRARFLYPKVIWHELPLKGRYDDDKHVKLMDKNNSQEKLYGKPQLVECLKMCLK